MCEICVNGEKAKRQCHQILESNTLQSANQEQIQLYDQHLQFKIKQKQLYEKSIQV